MSNVKCFCQDGNLDLCAACEREIQGVNLQACSNFFDDWFGPAFGPPEHLERIQKRHEKSRRDFANRLATFIAREEWKTK